MLSKLGIPQTRENLLFEPTSIEDLKTRLCYLILEFCTSTKKQTFLNVPENEQMRSEFYF